MLWNVDVYVQPTAWSSEVVVAALAGTAGSASGWVSVWLRLWGLLAELWLVAAGWERVGLRGFVPTA